MRSVTASPQKGIPNDTAPSTPRHPPPQSPFTHYRDQRRSPSSAFTPASPTATHSHITSPSSHSHQVDTPTRPTSPNAFTAHAWHSPRSSPSSLLSPTTFSQAGASCYSPAWSTVTGDSPIDSRHNHYSASESGMDSESISPNSPSSPDSPVTPTPKRHPAHRGSPPPAASSPCDSYGVDTHRAALPLDQRIGLLSREMRDDRRAWRDFEGGSPPGDMMMDKEDRREEVKREREGSSVYGTAGKGGGMSEVERLREKLWRAEEEGTMLRRENKGLKFALRSVNNHADQLIADRSPAFVAHTIGCLCGTFKSDGEPFVVAFHALALSLGAPTHSEWTWGARFLEECFSRALRILLRRYDPVFTLPAPGPRSGETIEKFTPPDVLCLLVQTADTVILTHLSDVLRAAIDACAGTERGVVLRILLTRAEDEILLRRKMTPYEWRERMRWARAQRSRVQRNEWRLDERAGPRDVRLCGWEEVKEAMACFRKKRARNETQVDGKGGYGGDMEVEGYRVGDKDLDLRPSKQSRR
ncbi:hypothetical protein IAT38_004289 [Cryptococcus sp. DSM 104549]